MFTTRQEVIESIATAIEANGTDVASREDFNLEQIADATYEYSTDLQAFVSITDEDAFWVAVEAAAL